MSLLSITIHQVQLPPLSEANRKSAWSCSGGSGRMTDFYTLSMNHKNQLWKAANRQIAHLANIKNPEVRRIQIVIICNSLKLAMRGGMA